MDTEILSHIRKKIYQASTQGYATLSHGGNENMYDTHTYIPGVSMKHIDGRSSSRSHELYVRRFSLEKQLQFHYHIDFCDTLFFQSGRKNKHEILLEVLSNFFSFFPKDEHIFQEKKFSSSHTLIQHIKKISSFPKKNPHSIPPKKNTIHVFLTDNEHKKHQKKIPPHSIHILLSDEIESLDMKKNIHISDIHGPVIINKKYREKKQETLKKLSFFFQKHQCFFVSLFTHENISKKILHSLYVQ